MGIHDLSGFRHEHEFDRGNRSGERRTWIVVAITAITMVVEIVAGLLSGSMALLADGWHMSTHVAALSIAGIAYLLAHRWSSDARFAFGTWKIEVLGAFTSALLLALVALAMVVESLQRFVTPLPIQYDVALAVAVVGLAVNLASAAVLHGAHGHAHHEAAHAHREAAHGHDHHHHAGREHSHEAHHEQHHHHGHGHHAQHGHHGHHGHHDLNLRSAYVHVVTDALTSVLAIVALAAGLWLGWAWLDPAMGIVGAVVILWWAKGLVGDSARVLLDREMDAPIVERLRRAVQSDGDAEIADLHVWRVGRSSYAAVITVVAEHPLDADGYRARVAGIPELVHVSVEVNQCPHGAACRPR